jgi:putative membrane-bound dehydrogenase-like protein
MLRRLICAAFIATLASAAVADEPDFSAELPSVAPTPPEKAIDTFQVKEGYRIELAAAEPLVASPVAICWDELGRMYVVEMRGYSEHRDDKLSRVRLVQDDNNDGVYDRVTTFADELLWPTAVACWDGGVFVADAPDILYLKDADGDGRAEIRRRVFTGFGVHNVQGLLNSFHWGLDNRIHGSASSCGGQITLVERLDSSPQPQKRNGENEAVNVNGRDFSFDPRTLDFRAESGGAQHGMTFDDFGRKFVCSNSDHCQQVMFEDHYVARNPSLAAPSARVSIATDGPQAEVFRSSPVEPWRIVRTRLRVAGSVPGPIEGGGRAAGYFTGATGVTVVRGSAFAGDEMHGMVVVGDVGSNLIHRKQLKLAGVQYKAERIDKESEFIASKDNWFRPAQFANGPDGALYVIDVYREVIEHPASLPPPIKKHLDLDSGRDRGRIWRVAPDRWKRTKLERIGELPDPQLIALLNSDNACTRETAARLIYQRQTPAAATALAKLAAAKNASAAGRVHALYALAGLGKLDGDSVLIALAAESPRLREHAIRLAGQEWQKWPVEMQQQVLRMLTALAGDDDAQVRMQLAFTLGDVPATQRIAGLAKLLSRDADDKWIRLACLTSLPDPYGMLDHALSSGHEERAALMPLLPDLALLAGRTRNNEALAGISVRLAALPEEDAALRITLLRSLMIGAGLSREQFFKAAAGKDERLPQQLAALVLSEALKLAQASDHKEEVRVAAAQGLALGTFQQVAEPLAELLSPQQSKELQLAALRALDTFGGNEPGELILEHWPKLSPETRRGALDLLVSRPERAKQFLSAIAAKEIPPSEIDAPHIELLKKHADAAVRDHAIKLFGSAALARRADVVEQYRGVLDKPGDAARGKQFFAKNCASCHKVEGTGHELGPNLAAMKNRGPETILLNVLDPNREVNPQFLSYVLVTSEGKTLSGIIAAESATSVTLRRADGQGDEVLRSEIEELRSTGLSLMPEGLEKQIDQRAMADVIAYLMSLK